MPKVWYHEKYFDYYELVDATDEELKEQFESTGGFFNQTLEDYIANYRKWEAKKLKRLEERAQKAREEVLKQPVSQQEAQPERKSHFSTPKSGSKDISADKRQELYNVIVNKENKIEDLSHFKQAVQLSNDRFLTHSKHSLGVAEECFYHLSAAAPEQVQREQEQFQEIQHELESGIENQNETLDTSCRTTKIGLENDIETLHKERNALPW